MEFKYFVLFDVPKYKTVYYFKCNSIHNIDKNSDRVVGVWRIKN